MSERRINKFLVGFFKEEAGLTMVEYAVAGALVSLAVVVAFSALGTTIAELIERLYGRFKSSG